MSEKRARQGELPEPPGEAREGFDERLGRLEAIVLELEAGGLGLEPAIARYREGVELLKGCRELLDGYRAEVEELAQGAEAVLRPYEESADGSGRSRGA